MAILYIDVVWGWLRHPRSGQAWAVPGRPDLRERTMDGKPTFGTSSNGYTITRHADLRWVQRAHEFECRLDRAWNRAEVVHLQSADFDRVRHDEETGTLLCSKNNELVTVLTAEYEQHDPITSEAGGRGRSGGALTSTHQHTTAAAFAGGGD
jgi:hypothetical protein